jgi:hypothetical protein
MPDFAKQPASMEGAARRLSGRVLQFFGFGAKQSAATARKAGDPLVEILDDWKWFYSEMEAGRFDRYRGQHIAIVGRQVLGSDSDPLRLRDTIADQHHLHPNRVVVTYIEGEDDWP